MGNKIFGTISFRIFLAVFLTTFIISVGSSYYQIIRVNFAFDRFLEQQEVELANMGWMRNKMEVDRLRRLEILNDQFRNAIIQNTLLSMVAGAVAALGTAVVLAKNITGPLAKMEKSIGGLMDDKFKGRLEEEGPYEIQMLIQRFNKLLDELSRIEKLRADLVSDITHELRTPLTKIRGQLEGVKDGVYKPDKELVDNLLANTSQLEAIIDRLQELIEIRSGQIKLKKVNIELSSMVRSVLAGYAKEGVEVVVNIDKGAKVKADRIRFRELLDNLISNAFKYTKKGQISIEASDRELKVSDSGIGIPEAELPYIFERFYRVDKSRNDQTGGLGLGLAIAKEIAEAHGFLMSVDSELKKGSTFTISFNS